MSASCFLQPLRVDAGGELPNRLLDRQSRVPDLEVTHARKGRHRLAVGAHRVEHDRAPFLAGEAVLAAADREARRQALHVPLPRAWRRLVEVVDVEDQVALGRAEDSEVRQMRVPAQLYPEPRVWCVRQIRSHDQRAAAVERKRRHQHPAVADRHQLRNPRHGLLLQQRDRVAALGKRDVTLRRPGNLRPRRLTPRGPLARREVRHHLRLGWRRTVSRRRLLYNVAGLDSADSDRRLRRFLVGTTFAELLALGQGTGTE